MRRVASRAWRADEGALRILVRLLASTHYQSALADVEHVLGGALDVHVAELGGALAGAALVAREGGIDPRLGPDVLAGRRRLQDQLLPQLLARSAGDGAALGARYARVVRIAVAPHLRRAGVGSALLRDVGAGSGTGAVDAVGASFAAEPGTTAFWLANGYRHFHEGNAREPAFGHDLADGAAADGHGPRRRPRRRLRRHSRRRRRGARRRDRRARGAGAVRDAGRSASARLDIYVRRPPHPSGPVPARC